jgi:hypothetical protein
MFGCTLHEDIKSFSTSAFLCPLAYIFLLARIDFLANYMCVYLLISAIFVTLILLLCFTKSPIVHFLFTSI